MSPSSVTRAALGGGAVGPGNRRVAGIIGGEVEILHPRVGVVSDNDGWVKLRSACRVDVLRDDVVAGIRVVLGDPESACRGRLRMAHCGPTGGAGDQRVDGGVVRPVREGCPGKEQGRGQGRGDES